VRVGHGERTNREEAPAALSAHVTFNVAPDAVDVSYSDTDSDGCDNHDGGGGHGGEQDGPDRHEGGTSDVAATSAAAATGRLGRRPTDFAAGYVHGFYAVKKSAESVIKISHKRWFTYHCNDNANHAQAQAKVQAAAGGGGGSGGGSSAGAGCGSCSGGNASSGGHASAASGYSVPPGPGLGLGLTPPRSLMLRYWLSERHMAMNKTPRGEIRSGGIAAAYYGT
jgi:hypothetical protein